MYIDSINVSYLDDLLAQAERIRQIVEDKTFESPYEVIVEIRSIFDGLDNVAFEKDIFKDMVLECNDKKESDWKWVADWFFQLRSSSPMPRKDNVSTICYKPEILKKIMSRFIVKEKKLTIKDYFPLTYYIDSLKSFIARGFRQFDVFLLKFEDRVGYLLAMLELHKNNIIDLDQKNNFIIFKNERL
jgi:hypothetical protein